MKKNTHILVLVVMVFCSMELMAFSRPRCEVFVWNKRNESIYLDIVVHPELKVEINGIRTYSFELLHEYLDVAIFLIDGQQIEVKPMEQKTCYGYHQYDSLQLWFKSLGPYEQFKMIYQDFTIRNKKGDILLDMSSLRPESFIKDSRGTDDYYLIIN